MALIDYGAMIGNAKGSISGQTFSRGKSGPTVKRKSVPVRRTRSVQGLVRASLGWISRQWSTLTNEQRALWDGWSAAHPAQNALGGTYIESGYQSFLRLNMLQHFAFPAVSLAMTEPPVTDPIVAVTVVTPSDGVADGAVVLTPTLVGTGLATDKLQIQVAGPFTSEGRVEVDSAFTDLTSAAGNAASVTVTDLQIDAWYWFRMRYLTLQNVATNWVTCQWQAPDVV